MRLVGDKMDVRLKSKLIDLLKKGLPELVFGHHAFTGVNDNFPSWDVLISAYAYKFGNHKDYYDLMLNRLLKYRNRLRRTTDSSEYNSPTYLQITLENMSDIVELLGDDPMAKAAQEILDTLTYSMLVRYHKDLRQVAGPFGRAYNVDSVGHLHHASYVLYMLLGEEYCDLPSVLYGKEFYKDGHVVHGDRPYYMLNFYNAVQIPYHVSDEIEQKFRALPKYPYVFEGSAEVSSSADIQTTQTDNAATYPRAAVTTDEVFEYPAGTCNLYTYMGEGYTLSTADKEFHNGIQTDSFFFTGRADNDQTATIFARMLTNDAQPRHFKFPLLADEGRKIGVQSQNSAMVLYHLRPTAAATPSDGSSDIRSIIVSLLIYNRFNVVDEVKQVSKSVFLRIGKQYLAFAPIDAETIEKTEIKTINDFFTVDFYQKKDDEKNAYRRGRGLNVGGFVCEVRDAKDYANIDDFIQKISVYSVNDYLYANRDTRMTVMRETEYDTPTVHLEIGTSVVSEGIFYKEIYRKDGKECPTVK